MADLGIKPPNTEKLVLTLEDKEKYVLHHRNLQLYQRQGMRLEKVHRVLEFDQESWMEPYIRMNTEFRKQAKSDFETNFFKLMNNSVFGKTMENLRSRVDVKIVRSREEDKVRKLISDPSYSSFTLFSVELEGVIGVGEVLFRELFVLPVSFNPVKKLRAVVRIASLSSLVSLESFVVPRFLRHRAAVARQIFRKVVAASESSGIDYSATKHHRDACHFNLVESFVSPNNPSARCCRP